MASLPVPEAIGLAVHRSRLASQVLEYGTQVGRKVMVGTGARKCMYQHTFSSPYPSHHLAPDQSTAHGPAQASQQVSTSRRMVSTPVRSRRMVRTSLLLRILQFTGGASGRDSIT